MNRTLGVRTALFMALAMGISSAASGNIAGALANLEKTTQSFLIFISAVFLLFGFALSACGALLYLRKVKGAYKPAVTWKAAAFGSGALGLILLFSGLMGIAILLMTPMLTRGLLAPG